MLKGSEQAMGPEPKLPKALSNNTLSNICLEDDACSDPGNSRKAVEQLVKEYLYALCEKHTAEATFCFRTTLFTYT